MSIKNSIFQLVFIFLYLNGFSQDYPNKAYYTALIRELESNPKIEEVKFVQNKSVGGKLKRQCLFVKYKDSTNYWQVGKDFSFYRNGKIKDVFNYNIINHTECDTTIMYNDDGSVWLNIINDNDFSKVETMRANVDFDSKYYGIYFKKCLRSSNIEQIFCKRVLCSEIKYVYNLERGRWVTLKEVYYNEDGTIKKEIIHDDDSNSGEKGKED